MCSSPWKAWLSLANREQRIGYAMMWSLLGGMCLLFAIPAVSVLPFLLNGKRVQGAVDSASAVAARTKFGPAYKIGFTYADAAGNEHHGVGGGWSADQQPGDAVAVVYLQRDPATAMLEANIRRLWPALAFPVAGVVILAAAIRTGLSGVRHVNRQLRQMSAGPLPQTTGTPR